MLIDPISREKGKRVKVETDTKIGLYPIGSTITSRISFLAKKRHKTWLSSLPPSIDGDAERQIRTLLQLSREVSRRTF